MISELLFGMGVSVFVYVIHDNLKKHPLTQQIMEFALSLIACYSIGHLLLGLAKVV